LLTYLLTYLLTATATTTTTTNYSREIYPSVIDDESGEKTLK